MPHFAPSSFLRHGLLTAVFSCAIALALTLGGQGPWDVQLAYSLPIGLTAWTVIDLGRALLPASEGRAWPTGWGGPLLIALGGACGYVLGSLLGDLYSGRPGLLWQQAHLPASLVITAVATAVISFFFISHHKARMLELQMARAQCSAAEARLRLLQAQLEPHMLFNTLANLRALIAADPPRALAMLDRLNDYLRATLGASRTARHPLADEFARVADYLALIAVRMGPRLAFSLDLPDALRAACVPPLLLQPLVENAIRHGLEPQVAGGRVTVQARLLKAAGQPPRLQLCVHDTGRGLAGHAGTTGTQFGLQQVRERLAALYGTAGALDLCAADDGGTSAIVTFPMESHRATPTP